MGRTVDRRRLKPVLLLSADLDGTLAGDATAEANFFDAWAGFDPPKRPLLVYNSGRLIDDVQQFLPQTNLPPPDVIIGGVGTMLLDFNCLDQGSAYAKSIEASFDRELIVNLLEGDPSLERQPDRYQNDLKSSWYIRDADPETISNIEAQFTSAGLQVQVLYSSGRDLDILPIGVNKGTALVWLCNRLQIPLHQVVVAGDTNNDRSMFSVAGVRGIVVANALPELRAVAETKDTIYRSQTSFADGVLEGLRHFGVL